MSFRRANRIILPTFLFGYQLRPASLFFFHSLGFLKVKQFSLDNTKDNSKGLFPVFHPVLPIYRTIFTKNINHRARTSKKNIINQQEKVQHSVHMDRAAVLPREGHVVVSAVVQSVVQSSYSGCLLGLHPTFFPSHHYRPTHAGHLVKRTTIWAPPMRQGLFLVPVWSQPPYCSALEWVGGHRGREAWGAQEGSTGGGSGTIPLWMTDVWSGEPGGVQ